MRIVGEKKQNLADSKFGAVDLLKYFNEAQRVRRVCVPGVDRIIGIKTSQRR